MSLNDLYYIFGIGNILFNIIISIITYLNKKTVENDKKEIEEIKKEVKESVESNKNERKSIEDIVILFLHFYLIYWARSLVNSTHPPFIVTAYICSCIKERPIKKRVM